MKFLVEAHLPRRLAAWLSAAGCDALHTLDLPAGNRTSDAQIIAFADADGRAVVTKDADFVNEHLIHGKPARLLLVSTGNITNRELQNLFVPVIPDIVREFQSHAFLELGRHGLDVRG